MESKNLGSEIDLSNSGCELEYEVLFDFELSESTFLLSPNQIINQDPESIGFDIPIDQPLIDLDDFFSSASPNCEFQNATNIDSPKHDDNVYDQSTLDLDEFFALENPAIDADLPNFPVEISYNNDNQNKTFGLNEIVRAVKVKEPSKRDKARLQRENGLEYLGYSRLGSKVVQDTLRPARQQGPHCISQFCAKCSGRQCKLFEGPKKVELLKERKKLFDDFWKMNKDQKQMYICNLIEKISIKQRRSEEECSRRKDAKEYFLMRANGERLKVCHKMFLSTFGLKEKMVRLWLNHKGEYGLRENPLAIQKRKNIKRQQSEASQALLDRKIRLLLFLIDYPKVESHYCRKDTGKEYFETQHQTLIDLYKDYVNICSNDKSLQLSFPVFSGTIKNLNYCLFKPRKDQCDKCTSFKMGNLDIDDFNNHRKDVDRASKEKEEDVKAAKMKLFILLCMDAEGLVLCPKLMASAQYFKSKLQLHNYTIYDILTHDSTNYVWDETESDLQSSTFTSIVVYHLENLLKSNSLPIIIYSDGCGYQNRNVVIANALRLLAMRYSRTITQKFLEVGHTHMECDSTHSCIERKSKGMTFDLPTDFEKAILTARDKPFPFVVEHLTHSFFRNYDDQEYLTYKSIRPGKKKGDPKVTDIRCLQYTADGKVLYKLHFDHEFELLPQPTKDQTISEPKSLHEHRLPVSNSKFKQLQELKVVLDPKSHSFYDNIPHLEAPEKMVTDSEKLQNLMDKIKLVKSTPNTKNKKAKVGRKIVRKSKE